MFRRVALEPAECLLQLPRRADAVAPAGLVPRDRDVDEALEEVPLLVVGGPPRELELLVRREEPACPNVGEAGLVGVSRAF